MAFLLVSVPLKPQSYADSEIISVEKGQVIVEKLMVMELDFLMEWNDRVYIICTVEKLLRIEQANIPYVLETLNFYPFNQKDVSVKGGINGDYHSYKELETDLIALENSYPHLAKVFDIGNSLEKRNIYALKISDNVNLDEGEAEVFFVGCHHAREWISVEVPFLIGKYLVENYEKSTRIKELVDQSEIWIVPLLNPDGLEYSIHVYRYWRKNRRNNSDGTYGVDLNRNYSYNWGYDDEGSSPHPSSGTYRGTSPFSEPETQVIRDFFAQRNLQAALSYHNYSQIILYPWSYTTEATNRDELLDEMASEMSRLMKDVNGSFYGYGQAGSYLYLSNGDTADWAFGTYGIPSFTIELPPVDVLHGGFFNAEEDIRSIFEENLPAALFLIDWSIKNFGVRPS